ncbi:MAG: filamentous hemagglutinin N-terminal domain-containing protein [Candidatus Marithrix sp.]|nr:filamentous hemagglutinin N-terminal domain-containing protein [Candidatus Marithrix sp.]
MIIRTISKFGLLLLFINPAYPEVIFDGSLGPSTSLLGSQFNIEASFGELHGGNLFHSFQQFNLKEGDVATFSGPNIVNNIIGRITGGASFIDGTLRSTIPQANLYLLNPNGFLLGKNANLDLQGSFHLTTANQLYLNDGTVLTTKLNSSNILTSSPPVAFGFLDSGTITIQGSKLSVTKDETLAISAHEINIDGGRLRAISGQINLSTSTNDVVKIAANSFKTNHSEGKITLKNNATVDVGKQETGDIYISSGQLFIHESTIVTDTEAGTSSGIIDIEVKSLLLDDGANIESRAFHINQQGNNIIINVAGPITLMNTSKIRTSSLSRNAQAGNAGNIIFNSESLNLSNDSLISTTTYGPGFGGNIKINVNEDININNAIIQASSRPSEIDNNSGNAGQIFIKSKNLNLFGETSKIDNNTLGQGQGGNIILDISNMLTINNGLISADSLGSGNAGNIRLNTSILEMNDGTISTAADRARGGNITINAQTSLKLINSNLTAKVSGGFGNGGNIAIGNPRFFNLQNSYIKADANNGNGGVILIVTGTPKDIYNSEITASSKTGIDGGVKIDGIYNVEVTTLPIDFLDASIFIKNNCVTNTDTEYSNFFIKGRGGLPNAPDDLQSYIPSYHME